MDVGPAARQNSTGTVSRTRPWPSPPAFTGLGVGSSHTHRGRLQVRQAQPPLNQVCTAAQVQRLLREAPGFSTCHTLPTRNHLSTTLQRAPPLVSNATVFRPKTTIPGPCTCRGFPNLTVHFQIQAPLGQFWWLAGQD